ncbi:MAG: hypothetical protein NVS3B20_07780 [Polyangiales bacterium]
MRRIDPDMVRVPTDEDLRERARALVLRMAALNRIVYVVALDISRENFESAVVSAGLRLRESDLEARVFRYSDERNQARLVALERPDLGVRIFDAQGEGAAEHVRDILRRVPFVPQSKLLREAIDVGSPRASKALLILAHMVVSWDDEWSDRFILHLAAPDPIARREAVSSVFLAAVLSGERSAAIALLKESHARERFPKLRDTIHDAITRLSAG